MGRHSTGSFSLPFLLALISKNRYFLSFFFFCAIFLNKNLRLILVQIDASDYNSHTEKEVSWKKKKCSKSSGYPVTEFLLGNGIINTCVR